MSTAQTNFAAAVQKLNDLQKERLKLEEDARKLMLEAFKEVFDDYPALESFSWTQYTPHFNDGDPCQFGAYIDEVNLDGTYETKDEDDIQDRLCTLLAAVDESVLETWGEGSIRIDRNLDVTCEDYDHD